MSIYNSIGDNTFSFASIPVPDCEDGKCRNPECAQKALDDLNQGIQDAAKKAGDAYDAAVGVKQAALVASEAQYTTCAENTGDTWDGWWACWTAQQDRDNEIEGDFDTTVADIARTFSTDVKAIKDKYKSDMAKCCEDCE